MLGAALEHLGAVRIDADDVAREVVAPGTPGLRAVADRFGPVVLQPDGSLDRAALAQLIFADDEARTALNGIVHPLVARRSQELMDATPPEAVVIYEIPLLAETGRADDFDVVVVVESEPSRRMRRLLERGLAEADAQARMAAQATDEQRRAIADELVSNDGSIADLTQAARSLWNRLTAAPSGRAKSS